MPIAIDIWIDLSKYIDVFYLDTWVMHGWKGPVISRHDDMKGDGIAKKVPKIGRQKPGNANGNSLHHKYVDAPSRQATEHAH